MYEGLFPRGDIINQNACYAKLSSCWVSISVNIRNCGKLTHWKHNPVWVLLNPMVISHRFLMGGPTHP